MAASKAPTAAGRKARATPSRVLNVGGGAGRALPAEYRGWEQHLLDIDPAVKPDIVCDAKQMRTLKAGQYDAVYSSHCLEHFYRHDVPAVLAGFLHVLKGSGFAHIAVPDVAALFAAITRGDIDIEDTWYHCPGGAISFHDVIYGWHKAMRAGNLYYAHRCGFSARSLSKALRAAGFVKSYVASDGMNLHAFAFKARPTALQLRTLGI